MDVKRRIKNIQMIEKMHRNEEFSKKLGLTEVSKRDKTANK